MMGLTMMGSGSSITTFNILVFPNSSSIVTWYVPGPRFSILRCSLRLVMRPWLTVAPPSGFSTYVKRGVPFVTEKVNTPLPDPLHCTCVRAPSATMLHSITVRSNRSVLSQPNRFRRMVSYTPVSVNSAPLNRSVSSEQMKAATVSRELGTSVTLTTMLLSQPSAVTKLKAYTPPATIAESANKSVSPTQRNRSSVWSGMVRATTVRQLVLEELQALRAVTHSSYAPAVGTVSSSTGSRPTG